MPTPAAKAPSSGIVSDLPHRYAEPMEHPLWQRLAAETRCRIDELIAADSKIAAIQVIRQEAGSENASLPACQELLAERYGELGEPWVRPTPPLDFDELAAAVSALPQTPDAIEALWDGDSDGWQVCLVAVWADHTENTLVTVRHGSDMRVFTQQGPPWPEAHEVATIGQALADHFEVPFHFASPDEPELDAPRWWERHC